jgi:hypothetical protein
VQQFKKLQILKYKTMQKQVNREETTMSSSTSFKEKFEAISSTPATRTVRLLAKSCCGCGCSDVNIERTVPYDSPLQNGDRVSEIERSDNVI